MRVRSGDRNRRILIQQLSSTPTLDTSGRIDRTAAASWSPFDGAAGKRWAKLHNQDGREFSRAKASHEEVSAVFDVSWDTHTKTIDGEHRVTFEGTTYELLAAFEVTDGGSFHETVRLVCKTRD